jgi:UDP-N-acetylglucosamine 2-epimerase
MIAALLERIAREYKVLFVLHEPTRRQLLRFNLYGAIQQNKAIEMLPLQSYLTFVDLMAGAEFVVTDGGSIQEETYFLNVPCLIMRSNTERVEGLGENAFLAEFDPEQIERFLQRLPTLRRQNANDGLYPSKVIVDHIESWA